MEVKELARSKRSPAGSNEGEAVREGQGGALVGDLLAMAFSPDLEAYVGAENNVVAARRLVAVGEFLYLEAHGQKFFPGQVKIPPTPR